MGISVKFADNTSYALTNADALQIEKGRNGIRLIINGGSFEEIKAKFLNAGSYTLENPDNVIEPSVDLTEFCVLYEILYQDGKYYVTMAQQTTEEKLAALTQKVAILTAAVESLQSEAVSK